MNEEINKPHVRANIKLQKTVKMVDALKWR